MNIKAPTLQDCDAVLADDDYGDRAIVSLDELREYHDGAESLTPLRLLASFDHGLSTAEGTAIATGVEASAILASCLFRAVGRRWDVNVLNRYGAAADLNGLVADVLNVNIVDHYGCLSVESPAGDGQDDGDGYDDAPERLFDWSDEMSAMLDGAGFVVDTSGDAGMTWFYLPGEDVDLSTYDGAVAYLSDYDHTFSSFGSTGADCAPFAAVLALILSHHNGDAVTVATLQSMMGMVVNDHGDVRSTLLEDAPLVGLRYVEDGGDYGRPSLYVIGSDDDPGDGAPEDYVDAFWEAYVDCALWSSVVPYGELKRAGLVDAGDDDYDDDDYRPLDDYVSEDDLSPASEAEWRVDVDAFIADQWHDLRHLTPASAGHDFWLTRNGHGAGFWDRGYGDRGQRLTDAAKAYGEVSPYIGDDGAVWS